MENKTLNYNKSIRQYVNFLGALVEQEMKKVNIQADSDYVKGLYFVNLFKSDSSFLIKQMWGDNKGADSIIRQKELQEGLMLMILVNDLYVSLSFKNATDGLSTYEEKLYTRLVSAIENNSYDSLIFDMKNIGYFIKATRNFEEISAYEKVLMIKSLNEENCELLNKINPFFAEEYKKLNIKVDKNFVMRQIMKWINATGDTEQAISKTASFLSKLFNLSDNSIEVIIDLMNSNNPDKVTQAFIDEDIEQIEGYVAAFYEAYKEEFKPKKK